MKNLIVGLTLACLASLPLAQAGDTKSSPNNKATAAGKAKATSSASAKAGCSDSTACSGTSQTSCTTEKSSCCDKEKVITKKVAKPSEKGATFLVKR